MRIHVEKSHDSKKNPLSCVLRLQGQEIDAKRNDKYEGLMQNQTNLSKKEK